VIYAGTGHTTTKFRMDRSPNPPHFTSAGNLIYNVLGDKAAEVALHSPVSKSENGRPYLGTIDRLLEKLPPEQVAGGIPLESSPFGKLPVEIKGYYRGRASGFTLADLHDGYIVLKPSRALRPVTVIEDFVTEKNIADANAYAQRNKDRKYNVEEFRGLIRDRVDRAFEPVRAYFKERPEGK
jgi:hypothetical protein